MIARRRTGWLAPSLLLAVCLALAGVVYRQVQTEPPVPIAAAGGEAAPLPALPDQPSFTMPPLDTFAAVVERPLFSPTRRPPEEGTVTIDVSEPELEITLVGVIISAEEQIAIIKPKDGSRLARLSLGDDYQGWTLDSIEPNRATFRRGDIAEHIQLIYDVPPPVQKPERQNRRDRSQRNERPAQVQGKPQDD